MESVWWIVVMVLVVWNALLTVGYMVCLRQTVVLSSKVTDVNEPQAGVGSGLALKREVGDATRELLSPAGAGATGFLFLSAGCQQCRNVADEAVAARAMSFNTVFVGVGDEDPLKWLYAAVQDRFELLVGDAAEVLIKEFDPLPPPFLVVVQGSEIHGWAQINSWAETIAQIDAAEATTTSDRLLKEANG